MSSKRLFIICSFLLLTSLHYGQCCGPAEIGRQYTITSIDVPSNVKVLWQLNVLTILYDSSQPNPNQFPSLFVGSNTHITIRHVTKKDGTGVFQHSVNSVLVYTCKLSVFKRASMPTCEPVTLTGNKIRTKCTTAQVFPQAKCQFTLQNGGIDKRDISEETSYITYTHIGPQPGGNAYYSTSCTLQYPVDGLRPGNWIVQVNMYPNQTGVSLDQGTTRQAPNTLMLSVPTVNIDYTENCPKGFTGEGDTNVRHGYIRQGERASCLCTRAHAGNPPGTIGWNSTQGYNFVILTQSKVITMIQINSPDTFTCRSMSVLDGFHSVTYIPKYAYGPSSASLSFQPPGPIYLCPNQQTNINITCQVPTNSSNPSPLFTIRDGNNKSIVTNVHGDTPQSKSVNYSFTKSGQYTFTCQAENAVFSDIFSEAPPSAIQVYAPPNSPPSFAVTGQAVITDNSGIWVKQGSDISVSCLAGEAYPLVESMTVTCGQDTSSSGPVSVSGVSGNGLNCQCAVDHETKTPCNGLNLNKAITIQTAYGPSEVKVSLADDQLREVTNKPLNLCSSEGLDVTLICAVKQSDVQPGLTNDSFTLTKGETFTTTQESYLDTSGAGYYRLVNNLRVTSGGSHTLVCEARNSKFSEIKKTRSMTIEVRVPPSDPPKLSARSNQHGDVLVEGDDVTVTCAVSGGYPNVESVTLTCGQVKSVTSNGTLATLTLNKIEKTCTCDLLNCTCQATHATGCYDLSDVLHLNVVSDNRTKAGEYGVNTLNITKAELTGAIVGSIVGTLVLVAAIHLIVFFVRRGKAERENRNRDTGYNKIGRLPTQPYQNVRPQDPNYLTINPPGRAPGPNSESPNQETDHTYRNQIFNDNTEPDPNTYSEIGIN